MTGPNYLKGDLVYLGKAKVKGMILQVAEDSRQKEGHRDKYLTIKCDLEIGVNQLTRVEDVLGRGWMFQCTGYHHGNLVLRMTSRRNYK